MRSTQLELPRAATNAITSPLHSKLPAKHTQLLSILVHTGSCLVRSTVRLHYQEILLQTTLGAIMQACAVKLATQPHRLCKSVDFATIQPTAALRQLRPPGHTATRGHANTALLLPIVDNDQHVTAVGA
jgi:hypothetical protein